MTNTSLWLVAILGLALIVRMSCILVAQADPTSMAAGYDRLAWSLANGSGFVTIDGTPTAYLPVGYPAFLAAIYAVYGHSWIVGGIANAVLGTITVGLTYMLARLMLPARLALVAALVVALWPSHVFGYTLTLAPEVLHTMLVLLALLTTYWAVRSRDLKSAALLGVCLGISAYVRPNLLLFPLAFGVVLALQSQISFRRAFGLASITGLVMLLMLLPWTARNYFAMDGFVLTATNGGINLLMGSGPGATGGYRITADTSRFPDTSEMTIYRESIDLTIEHVLSDPLAWIRLIPAKFFHLWAGEGGWARSLENASEGFQRHLQPWARVVWWSAQLHWLTIALIAAAAVVTRPIRYWLSFPAVLFPAALLYWTAFHMPVFGMGRFHAQMIPVVVVIAVHLLAGDRDWLAWVRPFRRGRHDAAIENR